MRREKDNHRRGAKSDAPHGEDSVDANGDGRMKRKIYEKELRKLQVELCHLQDWVRQTGARVIIVFEGRDAAGKGGTIKAISERVSPRVFRVVALPAPSDRQKSQMFVQRYIEYFPAAGEIIIFDRSWYNRAGVGPLVRAIEIGCECRWRSKFNTAPPRNGAPSGSPGRRICPSSNASAASPSHA